MKITENQKNKIKKILLEDEIEAISVVNPQIYAENIKNFEKILQENRLKYAIHSVLKVNHSNALLRTALKNNLRADVSSLGELNQALEAGFTGEKITANGPKNKKFLQKCIDENVLIVVDSIEELEKIAKFSQENQKKTKILVRLGAFKNASNTRFGIAKWLWPLSIKIIQENKDYLNILGYHFHIDTPDIHLKVGCFWRTLDYYKKLLKIGIQTKIINIGGGFGTFYKRDIKIHDPINNVPNQMLYVNSEFYGEYCLSECLQRKTNNTSIADFIRENNIELHIEPGRALLGNNVGFVATSIIGKREDSIIINSNSFSLGMREEELPTHPFLIDYTHQPKNISYWILGNLCLRSDVIYPRKIHFHREIQDDDILIFPNMAAYHMDFYETESILHPKKVKFFIDENDNILKDF